MRASVCMDRLGSGWWREPRGADLTFATTRPRAREANVKSKARPGYGVEDLKPQARRSRPVAEQGSDDSRQLLGRYRLGVLDIALAGDFASCPGRNVPGEDERREVMTKHPAQPGHDFKPGQSLRQIVVDDDDVGLDVLVFSKRDCLLAVCGCRGAMAVRLQQQFERIAQGGVVFDNQDRAAAGCDFLRYACNAIRHEASVARRDRDLDGKHRTLA